MRRTSVLCVLAVAVLVLTAFPAWAAVELFRVGLSGGPGIPEAPAYVNYTLNCTANITVEILPSDSAGVISGGAVRTETINNVTKGAHVYLWGCTTDAGVMAPVGYYVARVTANANPAQWDANIGMYKNWETPVPIHEWPYRFLDSAGNPFVAYPADTAGGRDEAVGGFYGIGVNSRAASPYYGRMYMPHQTNKHLYMYDVDGTYLGMMDDSAVTWGTSAPWDVQVADDDFVYVSDRTFMFVYCFNGDGTLKSKSVEITNDRAIFARVDSGTGQTYVFCSNGDSLWQNIVSADHNTWGARVQHNNLCTVGASHDTLFGFWVAPNLTTMYITSTLGTAWSTVDGANNQGVRRYTRTSKSATTWTYDATWHAAGLAGIACADVQMSPDGTALWVTRSDATGGIYKISVASGATLAGPYNLSPWSFMIAPDGVGNVAYTFGKSSRTWPGKYFGMFAEPGATSKIVTAGVCHLSADPPPLVIPGSETWTYTDAPTNTLVPDGSDTAQLDFKVLDANGFSDIGTITLDLAQLKTTSDPNLTVTVTPTLDGGDVNGLTGDCTVTISAVNGVQFGPRPLPITVVDADTALQTADTFHVNVAGNTLGATVQHTRTNAIVVGATITAVGGKSGVYGYPFTYTSTFGTDYTGYVEMPISEGTFDVTAAKSGFQTQGSIGQVISTVTSPASLTTMPSPLLLGPLSISSLRAYQNLQLYCSVEGVVYAQPKGVGGQVPSTGMDDRIDSYTGTTTYTQDRSFYMCDPDDPTNGMMFFLKTNTPYDTTFKQQWDDSTKNSGVPLYKSYYLGFGYGLGKPIARPKDGDTVCVTGWLETRPGFETRVALDDATLAGLAPANYKQVFYNLTAYGTVPATALPASVGLTMAQIDSAANAAYSTHWGKFGHIAASAGGAALAVTPVKWVPDGRYAPDNGLFPADPNRYVVVADTAGNWCPVVFQSTTSYGLPTDSAVCPVTIGDTYTIQGAIGRMCRFGGGVIRPRGAADITLVSSHDTYPDPDTVGVVRGVASGSVTFRGIVTYKSTAGLYVESSDRSVGAYIASLPWWINEGDDIVVTGNVMSNLNGIRRINPTQPVVAVTSGHAMPDLGMRHRDVGGTDYDPQDPGVTGGRGPLNVGLYVTVQGMVTFRDSASPFIYIWDGSNMYIPGESDPRPLDDGSGYRGLRVNNNGWNTSVTPNRGLVAWQDWITVTGVVGSDATAVPGKVIPVIIPKAMPTVVSAFTQCNGDSMMNDPFMDPNAGDPMNDSIGKSLVQGANLWGCPAQPAGTGDGTEPVWDPYGATNPMPWWPSVVFSPNDTTATGDNQIYRWENGNQSQILYDIWAPDAMGGIVEDDGYWLFLAAGDWSLAPGFSGIYPTIPQWYAVPRVGALWMGNPQNHDVNLESIQIHDGGSVKSYRDADQDGAGWITSQGYWWNNGIQSQAMVDLWDRWPDGGNGLRAWHGYTFDAPTADKAWIIP